MGTGGKRKKRIFISFRSQDSGLAESLGKWIQDTFSKKCFAFVSNKNINAGEVWQDEIMREIRTSDLLLVLCSPSSVTRPWVNFECGMAAASRKNRARVPVCYLGQRFEDLPPYLKSKKKVYLDVHHLKFGKNLIDILENNLSINRESMNLKQCQSIINSQIKAIIGGDRVKKGTKYLPLLRK